LGIYTIHVAYVHLILNNICVLPLPIQFTHRTFKDDGTYCIDAGGFTVLKLENEGQVTELVYNLYVNVIYCFLGLYMLEVLLEKLECTA
jgi:hypothetical protein